MTFHDGLALVLILLLILDIRVLINNDRRIANVWRRFVAIERSVDDLTTVFADIGETVKRVHETVEAMDRKHNRK